MASKPHDAAASPKLSHSILLVLRHLHGSKLGFTHTHSFDLMSELDDST